MRAFFVLTALLAGCTPTATSDTSTPLDAPAASIDAPGQPVPSPDGEGVCCPIDTLSCNCFHYGGFATTAAGCDVMTVCDAAPPSMVVTDEHGCDRIVATGSCLAFDAGR